jgi:UDP-glucose 4-epimerase
MKILVTGSEGYIGQHLVKKLGIAESLDIKGNPTWIWDIRKSIDLDEEYDVVIHLAALVQVGESVKDPYSYYETNINGTINVLTGIKTKHFILASTGAAESLNSPYALSKKACEELVVQYATNNDINYTIFRFYNVIGSDGFKPTNPDGLFFALIRAIETGEFNIYGSDYNTKDGTAIRDYVHVNQICDAIVKAVSQPSNSIECLGTGTGYTVLEIVNAFKESNYVNFNVNMKKRRAGDVERTVLDNPSTYLDNSYKLNDLLALKNYK